MRLRLAGVNDLIAAEEKYHSKCLNALKYDTQKTKKECETIDLAMNLDMLPLKIKYSNCLMLGKDIAL